MTAMTTERLVSLADLVDELAEHAEAARGYEIRLISQGWEPRTAELIAANLQAALQKELVSNRG